MKEDWNNAREIGCTTAVSENPFKISKQKTNEVTPFLVLLSSYGYWKQSLKTEWRT